MTTSFAPIPNHSLASLNTLRVPAKARFYAAIHSEQELQEALAWLKQQRGSDGQHPTPLLVLGGGSNIVLMQDFPGLVLGIQIPGIEITFEDKHCAYLKVGAGENWDDLVKYCLRSQFFGIENLSLIPGSVGAAPIQNIGAYGVELKDVFSELEAVDIESGATVILDNEQCEFAYRDSVFKGRLRDRYIICSVTLRLSKEHSPVIDYPGIRNVLVSKQPSAEEVADAVCRLRQAKLPDPKQVPNVGSFFKNPIVNESVFAPLKERFPALVAFPLANQKVKLSAAWLIDHLGWKSKRLGPVGVYEHQALVLVNPGGGSGSQVLALASEISASVKEAFGVTLEMEPRVYP